MYLIHTLLFIPALAYALSFEPPPKYMHPGNKECTLSDGSVVTPSWVGQGRLDNWCKECYCEGNSGSLVCKGPNCKKCPETKCPNCVQGSECVTIYPGCNEGKCNCPQKVCRPIVNTLVPTYPWPSNCKNECSRILCTQGQACVPVYSCAPNSPDCCPDAVCQDICPNKCGQKECGKGQSCELVEVQCVTYPCCPVETCVDKCKDPCASKKCEYGQCTAVTPTDCKDGNCCPVAKCEYDCTNRCGEIDCPDGLLCQMTPVQCVKGPCCPVPTCKPKCDDPCKTIRCPAETTCQHVYPIDCLGDQCCPQGECVFAPFICPFSSKVPCFEPPHGCSSVEARVNRRRLGEPRKDDDDDEDGFDIDTVCNSCPGVQCPDIEERTLITGAERCPNPCDRKMNPCKWDELCVPRKLSCKLKRKKCCFLAICEAPSIFPSVPSPAVCEGRTWSNCKRNDGCRRVRKFTFCGDVEKHCETIPN